MPKLGQFLGQFSCTWSLQDNLPVPYVWLAWSSLRQGRRKVWSKWDLTRGAALVSWSGSPRCSYCRTLPWQASSAHLPLTYARITGKQPATVLNCKFYVVKFHLLLCYFFKNMFKDLSKGEIDFKVWYCGWKYN